MPKYVIEREIPGAGKLSAPELQAISQKSCSVLNQMGTQIQGFRVTSPMTKFTACTSPQTKKWYENTRDKADFPPIVFRP